MIKTTAEINSVKTCPSIESDIVERSGYTFVLVVLRIVNHGIDRA